MSTCHPRTALAVGAAACAAALLTAPAPALAAFPGANGLIAVEGDPNGDSDVLALNPISGVQENLSDDPAGDRDLAYSADGTRIAFTSDRTGDDQIWVANSDGTGATNVSNSPNGDNSPSFSPDGSRIVFLSNRGPGADQDVWIMNADGSGQTALTDNTFTERSPRFSPDGSKIAFTSNRDGGDLELYVMNADGSSPTRITFTAGSEFDLSFSPDGAKLAYWSSAGIQTINLDGTGRLVLSTPANASDDSRPVWSPDGTRIAFTSFRDGNTDIFAVNATGGGEVKLTDTPTVSEYSSDWQALNRAPVAVDDAYSTGAGQAVARTGGAGVLANDADPDGDPITAVRGSGPASGTLSLGPDGSFAYQPAAGFSGVDTFTYRATDGSAASPERTVRIAVGSAAVAPPSCTGRLTSKLAPARISPTPQRTLDVLAPITARASGRASIVYQAAGARTRFEAAVVNGRIRVNRRLPAAQARLGTGILTIAYRGDADTRPLEVRLRAARGKALLKSLRPTIAGGRLRSSGTVSSRAKGNVRLQLEYDDAACRTQVLKLTARISRGRWSVSRALTAAQQNAIASRRGTVHSYIQFTGYAPARIRGEMLSFQVLGDR